ncbi:hypothetical protein Alide_3552 [Alicycliphilus denitrificans BC]|nr:hypothetical protein Alide_3552 [Alicycliphilus denitrificans BC]
MTAMTSTSTDRIDPIAILREEAIAAALAHGADRCEELADNLVQRYAQRVGGINAYVRIRRARTATIKAEVARRHNGKNTREIARDLGVSQRYVQKIVAQLHVVAN